MDDLLKLIGIAGGSMATLYYAFNLVSATAANWRLFSTLPKELKKQTELLEDILKVLKK